MRLGITSLLPDEVSAHELLTLTRRHWAIENQLHWVRDVTFDEDRSQLRAGHLHHLMARFRSLVISLLRLSGWHNIAILCRSP
jgi:predicted transposase YbfD/YdcC